MDSEVLRSGFVQEFINSHFGSKLILPRSVIFFHNDALAAIKRRFLKKLGQVYADRYNFSHNFFINSLLKLHTETIRLDLDSTCERQIVDVDLFARDKSLIEIRLHSKDRWITEYFRFMFEPYVISKQGASLLVDIEGQKAKRRLQKMINKKNLFDCGIIYNYDDDFVKNLFEGSSLAKVDDVSSEDIQRVIEYYSILDCPVGVSQEVLKQNYKKLAKAYHPDRVAYSQTARVTRYTHKFQMLQEAYSTLKSFG